jgi:DNA polymerase III sliding clamp (beta) subunit (PCNA family)
MATGSSLKPAPGTVTAYPCNQDRYLPGRILMSVKMLFEANALVLSAHNSENGETEETLDVEYVAEPITTAFNANFIRDILRSVPESDRVRLILKDKNSAAEFQPVTGMDLTMNRQIVMPCR